MSTGTGIEWTEATWNPLAGCTPVSPGCLNCYAATMANRLAAMGQAKYVGLTVKRDGRHVFNGTMRIDEKALMEPLRWKKPRTVFVNSMSDLFHDGVSDTYIDRVFAVMALTPHHTYQVLTKRPNRMAAYLGERETDGPDVSAAYQRVLRHVDALREDGFGFINGAMIGVGWPLRNVWLGTSVEDQKRADERIPHLLRCPAVVRFLSCEPLLGRIVFRPDIDWTNISEGIGWVIVGGESGGGVRRCRVEWIRDIVRQCDAADVPVFVKQLGRDCYSGEGCDEYRLPLVSPKGGDPSEWPEDLRVRQMPQPAGVSRGH